MKTFSSLILEYDCSECAASTEVDIDMPNFGETKTTYFACKECGQKNKLTVGLEPDDRKGKS